jgi:hypothetical protein
MLAVGRELDERGPRTFDDVAPDLTPVRSADARASAERDPAVADAAVVRAGSFGP